MNEHSEQMSTAKVASWQQWSVWLARTGYSDLELSTVMTLQQINRSKHANSLRAPATIYAAALAFERAERAAEQVELPRPLMLTSHDEM